MTIDDVQNRIQVIKTRNGDPEAQHSMEDALYREVLEAIREGVPNPGDLADAALRSKWLKFPRWCA